MTRQEFFDLYAPNCADWNVSVGKEKLDRLGIEPRTPTKANGRSTTELPALQVCRRSVEPQIPTAPPPRALSRPPGAVPCLSLLFVTDSQIGLDSLARARFLRCNGQRGSMS